MLQERTHAIVGPVGRTAMTQHDLASRIDDVRGRQRAQIERRRHLAPLHVERQPVAVPVHKRSHTLHGFGRHDEERDRRTTERVTQPLDAG